MRNLNKKQKSLIDKWFNENWTGAGSITSCNDIPYELIVEISNINDHETIYQNMDRYINDKALEKLYS